MNIPDFDLKELEEAKKRNFEERLAFIRKYVAWMKKTPNEVWSRQQSDLISGQFRSDKKDNL